MNKNKLLLAVYVATLLILSASDSFSLFTAMLVASFFITKANRRKVIFLRSFFAVAFFSGLTFVATAASSFLLGGIFDFGHIATLFLRSLASVFLTLSLVDRIGVVNIFSFKNELSIFFVMLFSKIETLKKEMNDFNEAARSRGLRISSMQESIKLLSIIVTALLLKSLDGFRASAEALRSRGQSA